MHCQDNLEVGLFKDVIVHDTNNNGQYRLGLQIDSLDRNHLCTTEETDTKTENYQQNNEEHQQVSVVCKYLGSSIFLHLPLYLYPPHYHLLWEWNNFKHTEAYTIHNFYMPNTKPRK